MKFNTMPFFVRLARDYVTAAKFVIVVVLTMTALFAYEYRVFDRFENITLDHRFQMRHNRAVDPKIVLVEIAEDSVEAIGRWPWDRTWHAALVQALTAFGAKSVAFDILFSEDQGAKPDAAFSETIRRCGNVYVPSSIYVSRGARGERRTEVLRALPQIRGAAKGEGHISVFMDSDGVLRRIQPLMEAQGEKYWQLGIRLAMERLGTTPEQLTVRDHAIYFPVAGKPAVRIPLEDDGSLLINWPGTWKNTFKHVSFVDVVVSYQRMLKGEPPRISTDMFKDAVCIVGASATALYDIKATPMEPAYPAMGVNAIVLNSILQNTFVKTVSYGGSVLLFVLLGLAIFWTMLRPHYTESMLLIVLLVLAVVCLAYGLFFYAGVVLPIISPLFLILSSYAIISGYHQIVISIERNRLMRLAATDAMTGLYNISHFKRLLAAELLSTRMTANKNVSLIMADVDHFKKINDEYGHPAGDEVLKVVAQALRANCRALDVTARYGGEEFVLMLPGAPMDAAMKIAEKIRQNIEQRKFCLAHDDRTQAVTASFGVTAYQAGESADEFLKRADKALYQAKNTGRNRIFAH